MRTKKNVKEKNDEGQNKKKKLNWMIRSNKAGKKNVWKIRGEKVQKPIEENDKNQNTFWTLKENIFG